MEFTKDDVKNIATRIVDTMNPWEYDFECEQAIEDTVKTLNDEPLTIVKWLLERIESLS